jgi:alpha-beta hydrolase superfamily lysophospholipase
MTAVCETIRQTLPDGTQLHVRVWTPTHSRADRTVLWIHGGCEHGGRYDHVATRWAERGWRLILPDHRGHGLSDGVRTDVLTFEQYLEDLQTVLKVHAPNGRADLWVGHSMGGLLAARLAQTTPPPRGVILSSPLLGLLIRVPLWKWCLGQLLVSFVPTLRFRTGLDPHNMTRDEVFLERRRVDPDLQRTVTARWFFALQAMLRKVQRDAARVQCPLLLLQGLADRTVDPQAARDWLRRTSAIRRELIEYPECVHELLNDTCWPEVTETMLDWAETVTR